MFLYKSKSQTVGKSFKKKTFKSQKVIKVQKFYLKKYIGLSLSLNTEEIKLIFDYGKHSTSL